LPSGKGGFVPEKGVFEQAFLTRRETLAGSRCSKPEKTK
jgi:hypothetical protein